MIGHILIDTMFFGSLTTAWNTFKVFKLERAHQVNDRQVKHWMKEVGVVSLVGFFFPVVTTVGYIAVRAVQTVHAKKIANAGLIGLGR